VLKNIFIPEFVGAALVIAGAFALIGFVGYQLSAPLSDWVRRIPEIQKKLQADLQKLKKPVEQVSQAGEQVRKLTSLSSDDKKKPQAVELKNPSVLDGLFSRTWDFMFGFVVMVILLYFLLASGDLFLRKLIHVLPRLADKKKAVQIARQIEEHISRYLVTVAMINATLGIVAGLLLWALGMPNPMLWGAMAGLFNFVPFLGAVTVIAILTLVATATFSSLGHAFLIPAAYMGLALLEGNLINPLIVGRRLTLNPVVIFLGLTFWGWLWGISGALLAVPMLAMFKIFCDHIEPLAPIGEFLGH
jgi:predicted PurR-regulated permease PerM